MPPDCRGESTRRCDLTRAQKTLLRAIARMSGGSVALESRPSSPSGHEIRGFRAVEASRVGSGDFCPRMALRVSIDSRESPFHLPVRLSFQNQRREQRGGPHAGPALVRDVVGPSLWHVRRGCPLPTCRIHRRFPSRRTRCIASIMLRQPDLQPLPTGSRRGAR